MLFRSLVKNPLVTSGIGTGVNIATGQDPTTALTNLGIGTALPLVKNVIPGMNADPTSAAGILQSVGLGLAKNAITGTPSAPPRPTQLTTAPRITPTTPQVSPLTQLASTGTLPTSATTTQKAPTPPRSVAANTLTPITPLSNIAGLTSILQPRA